MGSRGDNYDNAMIGSLNRTFKAELIKLHGPWRSRDATEIATLGWVHWFNETRLSHGAWDLSRGDHEADWYRHNPVAAEAITT